MYVNGFKSEELAIKAGVPQGSILGPWFYLLFSNDMPSCIDSNKTKMILYADDTILLSSGKDLNEVKDAITSALYKCHHWFTNNNLVMHSGKTETILLTSKRKKHLIKNFVLNYLGNEIQPSEEIKYLGLKIDSLLTGKVIVDNIVTKCNARIKYMARYKDVLDFQCRKKLTSALIQCYFDYASTAWYFSLTQNLKRKLQVSQNKIVRFILNLHPRESIRQYELDKVGILSVADRARQLMLSHMYKVYNKTSPSYLRNEFTLLNSNYNTRHSHNCFVNAHSHGIASLNFSTIGAKEWNSLPDYIKTSTSKELFKKNVKKFLRTQAHLLENSDFIMY